VSQFINTTGLMMLVPIMPFYVEQLGVHGTAQTQTWAGAAIAAPAVTLTVATPLWGRLGDRIGRKWMVVRALIGLGAAMLVMAAATGPVLLLVGRLLQGALGGVVEAAAGFVGATADEERGTSLGKSFSATAAGALTGPLIGGTLLGANGLPTFMVTVAVAAFLLALLCAWGLREAPRPHTETRDQAQHPSARSRLRLPGLAPLAAAAVLVYLGVYGLIPVFAAHVANTVAQPGTAGIWVGALHSIMWAATLLGSFWWGRHNDRTGRPLSSFVTAAWLCAVSIAAVALPIGLLALIPLRIVQGFAFAALAQSLFLHFSRTVPGAGESGRVGMINGYLLLGQGAGPLLAGPLTGTLSVPSTILLLGGSCAGAAILTTRARHAEQRSH
jgi:MFS transporter, DHA1 family, staphyloferrin B biosynthesis exporter